MKHFLSGGIGDFIQSIDSLIDIQNNSREFELKVFTHFAGAKEFLAPFLLTDRVEYISFSSREEYIQLLQNNKDYKAIPKILFQNFKVPQKSYEAAKEFSLTKPNLVGIHPVGSKFSNDIYSQFGIPQKVIAPDTVAKIISIYPRKNYLIFGTEDELKPYKEKIKGHNVSWVQGSLWDNLAHILFCDYVIAVDSSIKSFSAARKIKTIIALPDIKDDLRDNTFILPYERTGVMYSFRYKDLTQQETEFLKFVAQHANRGRN